MSNIFFNIEPKVINTELACLIGLNEAIVLQQLHYWIEKNKATSTNAIDGRVWTYGTIQEYRDRDFRFWSVDTVKRTLGNLVKRGFLIKGNYNKMKMDHTNWYAIDYVAIDKWINQNTPAPGSFPPNMAAPIEQGKIPPSESADCPHRAVQVAPTEQGILPPSDGADCPQPSAQVAPMEQGRLPHAIQENKKEINNQRLTNKTNTQETPPLSAAGVCDNQPHAADSPIGAETAAHDSEAVAGEVIFDSELLFDKFWKLYPRKESKDRAKKAWIKLNPCQELFNLIANALEYRSQTKEWLAEGGRYVPHPEKWLNGKRWEDEIDPQKFCRTTLFQQQYGDVLIDGKPLDPVQRKQLEYIEKQMRAQAGSEGV
jgi:hypothetical protein